MRTPLRRIQVGGFVLAVVFASAVFGYRFIGGYGWLAAIWMVVITISTVGYSESPQMPPSVQMLSVVVILLGISASAYTFGGLIQLLLEGELERAMGKRRMSKEISQMSDHIIICGFGRMGKNLARELKNQHRSIVVIDEDAEAVIEAAEFGLTCVQGDATEESALESAGLSRAAVLVSTFPNDAESVFITLTARNLNPTIRIVARAERESTKTKLVQAGADTIVMPLVVGARQMGREITRPSTAHLFNMVDEGSNREFDLDEIEVVENSPLAGMTVQQTEAHRRHKLLVVAIKGADGNLRFNPDASEKFNVGEVLLLLGHRDDINRFQTSIGS